MENSQTYSLAQALFDSIGPRLTGSPNLEAGHDWLHAIALSRPYRFGLTGPDNCSRSCDRGKGPTPQLTDGLVEPMWQRAVEPYLIAESTDSSTYM